MNIEIKIDCKNTADSEVISSLLPHLQGMNYQISVVSEAKRAMHRKPLSSSVPISQPREISTVETAAPKARNKMALGEKKRKVLEVIAADPKKFYTLKEITSLADSMEMSQVRSVIVDAIYREEVQKQIFNGVHMYQITDRGINRLEQGSKKNTQSPLRPMVAA